MHPMRLTRINVYVFIPYTSSWVPVCTYAHYMYTRIRIYTRIYPHIQAYVFKRGLYIIYISYADYTHKRIRILPMTQPQIGGDTLHIDPSHIEVLGPGLYNFICAARMRVPAFANWVRGHQ